MKRKVFSLLTTLAMCMTLIIMPAAVQADTSYWTEYAEAVLPNADGVYEISTAEGLAWLAKSVNDGTLTQYTYDENWDMVRSVFRLTADINLSDHLWLPIGKTRNSGFMAVFDGGGHTVSGLRVGTADAPYSDGYYAGLFGYVSGEIVDVKITDAAVYAATPGTDGIETYAGLIAGYFGGYNTGISNCDVSGSVYTAGTSYSNDEYAAAAGIAGNLSQNGFIESCRAYVTVGALDADKEFSLGGISAKGSGKSRNCVSVVTASIPDGTYYDSIAVGGIYAYGTNAENCIGITDCGGANRLYISPDTTAYKNTCIIETNLKEYSNKTYKYEPLAARYTYYGNDGIAQAKTEGEMKSSAFADILNSASAGIDGAKEWSISEDENGGFPNIKKAGIRQYYTVTFVSAGETVISKTVPDGGTLSLPDEPSRAGYTFLYWYSEDEDTPYDFSEALADNLTLTAKWDAHGYAVLFDSCGGTFVFPQKVYQDETVSVPDAPKKSGFSFGGWYKDRDYTEEWDFAETVSGPMALYAKWTDATGISVTGRITDAETGDGISGAQVTLSNGQNALTDTFGFYRITNVSDGSYTVTVSADGYGDFEEEGFTVENTSLGFDAALNKLTSDSMIDIYANISCVYSGIMLRGVQIRAVGEGDLGTYTKYTDENGFAQFSGIPAGNYVFHINEAGRAGWESYVSETHTLTGDYNLSCALKPNYQQLTVTVTGFDPVLEAKSAPLPGKTVKFTGLDPKDQTKEIISFTASTDENGVVTVEKLVPVTWKITCSSIGYETAEAYIYSDGAGNLTQNNLPLTMRFADSPVTVSLTSPYADPDIFKTRATGESDKFTGEDSRAELKVELIGTTGTLTEGIVRETTLDENGKANFEGLLPGSYRVAVNGAAKRYVSVLSGVDSKEIYSSTENTRYGPKYFYAEFSGTGTAAATIGKASKTSVRVTPDPVSFSGTLYKSDMNADGTITTVPVPNTKIIIKPSAYYTQNGENAAGHEITTDENGFYSVTLAPGLYGVEVDGKYKDYFGGHLIYHEGATDTCYYDYNVRGWPCTGKWLGTRKSAWAWLSSGTQQPYGDIAGMNLSSGTVIADLVMMEKQFTYLLGDINETASGVGIGMETAAEMHMITGFEPTPESERDHDGLFYHTFKTSNYHTESRGATVTMSGAKDKTLAMTGEKFPAIFNELDPGEYTFTYTLSDTFSHLSLSDWTNQTRERLPHNGVKSFTFYDFPAPGKLPDADHPFPEDYVDINYPDDRCKNPWPLSTVADTQVTVDFDQDADGHRTFYDLYDNDESDGELHFKFYNLDLYTSEYIDLSEEYGQARLQFMQSHPEEFDDLHVCTGEATLSSVDETGDGSEAELMAAVMPQTAVLYEYIPADTEDNKYHAHMDDALVRDDDKGYIMSMLFAYETDKIPGKLFYTGHPRQGYYRRDQWNDQSFTSIPDGNVTLYFCAANDSYWDQYVLSWQSYHRNPERYPELCNNDLWFSVELKDNGPINCFLDFLNPGNCSAGTHILSQSEIKNLLNPRTIKVKAVESGNVDNELNIPVSVTLGGSNVFTTGQTYAEQTCSSSASAVTVNSDEWECPNPGMITGEYDEGSKTETIIVPLTRKQYVNKFSLKDDAGNPISGADISLTGALRDASVIITSKEDGSAQAGTITHYSWSNTDEINSGLTYQQYAVKIIAKGYESKSFTLTETEVTNGETKEITLQRAVQPEIGEDTVKLDKKGAFLPGVNYVGSSNTIEFLGNALSNNSVLSLGVEGDFNTLAGDNLKEIYIVDRKAFKNKDYSDSPEELAVPSTSGAEYNPSAVLGWLERLRSGDFGNVYYHRFEGENDITFEGKTLDKQKNQYKLSSSIPLWELPPDGFEPAFVAVTDKDAVAIYNIEYEDDDEEQLVGIRLDGDMATMLNNITLMANAKALGGGAVDKLLEIAQPTGSVLPLPSFTASVEEDDGFLTYKYNIEVQLLQGKQSVSGPDSANLSLAPATLGIMISGDWNMSLDGKERAFSEGYDVKVSAEDMDVMDYLPPLFNALPVKIEFDESNPPTGTVTLTETDTKDKKNNNVSKEYSFGVNGQVHVNAQISAFKSLALVPTVGPILVSLEKSGALDIGAQIKVAAGADGTYTYTVVNGGETSHEVEFTVGVGAGIGVYANAFGGALGAEANLKLSGDNDKLEDMTTASATVGSEGFKLNNVEGKLTADAHIEISTWFINGEKDFEFGSIPFKYQFGTETQFTLTPLGINGSIRSRDDFDPSTFNGRPETVIDNLLPIGGYAADEGSGTFVYTDMETRGGDVKLCISEYRGDNNWNSPVEITSSDGLIPSYDIITLADGNYLAIWTEIAKEDMAKTCPPSDVKFTVGTVKGGAWTGEINTLESLPQSVYKKLLLVKDSGSVYLAALKTSEGALAEKMTVYGYKYTGGAWGSAFELAKDKSLYDISACAASGALIVSFVTSDKTLHILSWDGSVSEQTFSAYGYETALCSDGTAAYLVNEAKKGLSLYARNDDGSWSQKQYSVTKMMSTGNPAAAISGDDIIISWSGDGNKTLYSAAVNKNGRVVSADNIIKTAPSGKFKDTAVFTDDGTHIMTVLSGSENKLNVYDDGYTPEEDTETYLTVNSVDVDEDTGSVEVQISIESEEEAPRQVLATIVDISGNLADLDVSEITDTGTLSLDETEDAKYIKVFWWESLQSMKPIAKPTIIRIDDVK
ncbi:MAG: carboxypeptidase regulatory-like domain-containing protein [Clostridia bacterium]|nr:carboxypeptidase regulatory-like domain-containing protein [Clostridia bacterium]